MRWPALAAAAVSWTLLCSLPSPADATASTARPAAGQRVILGRLVDLGAMRAVKTLTETPPDEELTTADEARAILLGCDGRLQGWDLAREGPAWTKSARGCQHLVLGGPHVYAVCINKFMSFQVGDGASRTLDDGPEVMEGVAVGPLVAVRSRSGRVTLFDAATNSQVVRKALPELVRALHPQLFASPGASGPCVVAHKMDPKLPNGWAYRIGCYDRRLERLWKRTISFPLDPEATYFMVRQAGPHHVVLDDQPLDERGRGQGRGVTVRLRDGTISEFADGTFASLEKRGGERVTAQAVLDLLRPPPKPAWDHPGFAFRSARVAVDGERAYALIVNESTELVGVELSSGRVLFRVPVALGNADWALELARGFPIIRSRSEREWRASIHDPSTGRVLYEDQRAMR